MTERNEIEQADSIRVAICPDCSRPHLLLLDEHGDIFATAVITDEVGRELIAELQNILYRRATLKSERAWPRDKLS